MPIYSIFIEIISDVIYYLLISNYYKNCDTSELTMSLFNVVNVDVMNQESWIEYRVGRVNLYTFVSNNRNRVVKISAPHRVFQRTHTKSSFSRLSESLRYLSLSIMCATSKKRALFSQISLKKIKSLILWKIASIFCEKCFEI